MANSGISKETREAIEAITEFPITTGTKAKLALFSPDVIRKSHDFMVDMAQKGNKMYAPDGFMIKTCISNDPLVNVSHSNPLLKAIMQAQDQWPHAQTPLSNHPSKPTKGGGRRPGAYDQNALVRKAEQRNGKRVHEKYTTNQDCGRPGNWHKHGKMITDDDIDAYAQRMGNPPYEMPDSELSMCQQKKDYSFYENKDGESRKSIAEICDNFSAKVKQFLDRNVPIPTIGNESAILYAKRCVVTQICHHLKLYRKHYGLEKTTEYLNGLLFQDTPPDSVRDGILLTESEYGSLLAEELEACHRRTERKKNEQKS